MSEKSVILGLSGGVDSAVSAALLKRNGYKVTGAFCIMHDSAMSAQKDAEAVANAAGINFITLDLRAEFEKNVIDPFINSYINGRTPNPCIGCNPAVKFDALVRAADKLGADFIATGHYSGIHYNKETDRYCILTSQKGKDQSYMLYRLSQEQLRRIIFPLYNMEKPDIRELARKFNIPVAEKKDSQEICFINGDYKEYIENRLGRNLEKGKFILEENGEIIGEHKGIAGYTIGQRKGLGLSVGSSVFITKIDAHNNNIYVSRTDPLFSELICCDLVWQEIDKLTEPMQVAVKIRYAAKPAQAVIAKEDNGSVRVTFYQPQRAVTPGQSAVFYNGDKVIGGGIIR